MSPFNSFWKKKERVWLLKVGGISGYGLAFNGKTGTEPRCPVVSFNKKNLVDYMNSYPNDYKGAEIIEGELRYGRGVS